MRLESTIIERVETFVHHRVYSGSDRAIVLVLAELESLERRGQIGQVTYRTLRELIVRFAAHRRWSLIVISVGV
jgi:hypothetical protein